MKSLLSILKIVFFVFFTWLTYIFIEPEMGQEKEIPEFITLPDYAMFDIVANPDKSTSDSVVVLDWKEIDKFKSVNPNFSFSEIPSSGKIPGNSDIQTYSFETESLNDNRLHVNVVYFDGDYHNYSEYIVENETIKPIKSKGIHGIEALGYFMFAIFGGLVGSTIVITIIKIFLPNKSIITESEVDNVYNLSKKQTGIDSEYKEQPKRKKGTDYLRVIRNLCLGVIGILILYVYLQNKQWSEYFSETQGKNHVVSVLQKTSVEREFYEENNRFSSSETYKSEKMIDSGMEYDLSFRFENNMIDIVFGAGAFGEESFNITLVPKKEGSGIFWNCEGGNLPAKYRPPGCRKGFQNSEERVQSKKAQARRSEYNRRKHAQEIFDHFDYFKNFYEEHNIYPTNAPITEKHTIEGVNKGITIEYELSVNFENNVIDIIFGKGAFGEEPFNITLIPKREGPNIIWDCTGGNLPAKYRPEIC